MNPVYVPATKLVDWQKLLAQPEKHWREGFSAMSIATAWHNANGFPGPVAEVFSQSGDPFRSLVPLIIIPEHKVHLSVDGRPTRNLNPSQNDVWVLAAHGAGLASITVEGKVSESFGPPLSKWLSNSPLGKPQRLDFLKRTIGLERELPGTLRYQLFHRTASAVIEARRFQAKTAIMLVHSFSPLNAGLPDYLAFLDLFGATGEIGKLVNLGTIGGISLHVAWVRDVKSA